jgi:hypothetical protein
MPSASTTIRIRAMAIHVLDSMGKLASRFVHELLPVALASVIGTLVVNHYARQPASPSVVVQAQPSASEDAIAQSLREEHELIASFVKRSQDRDNGDQRSDDLGTQAAPIAFSLADPPLPEPRPAAAPKTVARLAPKVAVKKKLAPTEAPPPELDLPTIAPESPPMLASSPAPAQLEFEPRVRPVIRLAGAVREWAADIAQAPGRVAFAPRWPDWPSAPSLIRPLALFRQN